MLSYDYIRNIYNIYIYNTFIIMYFKKLFFFRSVPWRLPKFLFTLDGFLRCGNFSFCDFFQGRACWIVPFHSSSQRHLGIRWGQQSPGAYMRGMLQGMLGFCWETSVYCWSWETNSWHLNFDPLCQSGIVKLPILGDQTLTCYANLW